MQDFFYRDAKELILQSTQPACFNTDTSPLSLQPPSFHCFSAPLDASFSFPMATMARSMLVPTPLSATSDDSRSDRRSQISLFPLKIARSTRTTLQRGGSVLVSVASKDPAATSANKGDAK